MTNRVFVLLGSNIEKEKNLPAAVKLLSEKCRIVRSSSVYETCPVGLEQQPTFFNAAVLVETDMTAFHFRRDILEPIEAKLRRVRTDDKNAPRTIDVDLILFDLEVFDLDDEHHIPDPDLLKHRHVIVPTAELEPELVHPESGDSLGSIAYQLVNNARKLGKDPLRKRSDIVIEI